MTPALLAAGLAAGAAWLSVPPCPARRSPLGPDASTGGDARDARGSHPARARGWRARLGRRRHTAAVSTSDVARCLVLLALVYRSGLPTTAVLLSVAGRLPDAVARDLRQVAAALKWGATEAEAWASVDPIWAPAARAVRVSHLAGVPPGSLLLRAADDLQQGEVERLEVAAARAGVRLVLPLGLVLLPAFCLTTVVPLVVALGRDLLAGR